MIRLDARAYGVALVTSAAVLWSTGGLFVRLLGLDLWTMLAWRSLFAAFSLVLVVMIQMGEIQYGLCAPSDGEVLLPFPSRPYPWAATLLL